MDLWDVAPSPSRSVPFPNIPTLPGSQLVSFKLVSKMAAFRWRRKGTPFRLKARCFNADGRVLEDVPYLTDFLPNLPAYPNPIKESQAYAIVKWVSLFFPSVPEPVAKGRDDRYSGLAHGLVISQGAFKYFFRVSRRELTVARVGFSIGSGSSLSSSLFV